MIQALATLLASAVAVLLGGRFLVRSVRSVRRLSRLKKRREGWGEDDFVAEVCDDRVDEALARRVYRQLQSLVAPSDFPVQADNPLVAIYGIDESGGVELSEVLEELDESILWEQRLHGEVPGLETVRDLARLVAEHRAAPAHAPASES